MRKAAYTSLLLCALLSASLVLSCAAAPADGRTRGSAPRWQLRQLGAEADTGSWAQRHDGAPGRQLRQSDAEAAPLWTAVANGPWGNADTWSPAGMPPDGSRVLVPAGVSVVWAGDTAASLQSLLVQGQLSCGGGAPNISLLVGGIHVNGQQALLACGSPSSPFRGLLNISLTGAGVGCVWGMGRVWRCAHCAGGRGGGRSCRHCRGRSPIAVAQQVLLLPHHVIACTSRCPPLPPLSASNACPDRTAHPPPCWRALSHQILRTHACHYLPLLATRCSRNITAPPRRCSRTWRGQPRNSEHSGQRRRHAFPARPAQAQLDAAGGWRARAAGRKQHHY